MKRLAIALSFGVGLLSLSQEILWVRLVSFGHNGRPHAFAIVLAAFLVGIALGAAVGRQLCGRSPNLLRSAGIVLAQAAFVDLAWVYLSARVLGYTEARLPGLVGLIALTAMLKAIIFPIVHHLGSDASLEHRIGRSVSRVYLANVLGAAIGPIVTGYWLLDLMGVAAAMALIGTLTAALSTICLVRAAPRHEWLVALAIAGTGVASVLQPPQIIETLAMAREEGGSLRHVIQNKHGIIHVLAGDGRFGDTTFGGNVYDGAISTDLRTNMNGLDRAYLMATMHPAPRRVLVIGLSTGAWTRVVLGMPGVERVDAVEINPGYVDLIERYPAVAPILSDPRVQIHVDDGRRWMRAHIDRRYDLIFQNTTFHWRAYSTMLLSEEYLRLTARLLAPGGILAVNTTGSADAYRTALEVFPHVARYASFAYMSQQPLVKRADAEAVLRRCRIGDEPAFADDLFERGRVGDRLARAPLEPAAEYLRTSARYAPTVITDMNLLPEFRRGQPPLFGLLDEWLPRQ